MKLDPKNLTRGQAVLFGLGFVVLVIACVALLPDSKPSSAASPAHSEAGQTSSAIAPLNYSSSGRLPTELHGFRLGMTPSEALARDSSLENWHNKGKPPSSDFDGYLVSPLRPVSDTQPGFDLYLTFSHGRLFHISSTLAGSIAPEDAALFDRNILVQLGPPDAKVYGGSERQSFVWADGDVRVKYEDRSLGITTGKNVGLELVVLPVFLSELQASVGVPNDFIDSAWSLSDLKRQWGVEKREAVLKELPHGMEGVELRMLPWQVRAALPGVNIVSSLSDPTHKMYGKLERATSGFDIDFWDQQVSHFCQQSNGVGTEQFDKIRSRLMDRLGTPTSEWKSSKIEWHNWEDAQVTLRYAWWPSVGKDGKADVSVCFTDKQLDWLSKAHEMTMNPPSYHSVPDSHSFF